MYIINFYIWCCEIVFIFYFYDVFFESNNFNFYICIFVKKILFDDKKKVIGVKVSIDGFEWIIGVKKEVIFFVGVMCFFQFLMVLGIGFWDIFEKFDIFVFFDCFGVGKNM